MFTGIVEVVGRCVRAPGDSLEVSCSLEGLRVGDSIAVNGVCVTVTSWRDGAFTADLSPETRARTNFGTLGAGSRVNLERPLSAGGLLGGHIVQGHVDGTGAVVRVEERDSGAEVWIRVGSSLRRYLVPKGSVSVDGVSLTIAGVEDDTFSCALIPHTLRATNLGERGPGDTVNIEVDVVAKYVESFLQARAQPADTGETDGIRNG